MSNLDSNLLSATLPGFAWETIVKQSDVWKTEVGAKVDGGEYVLTQMVSDLDTCAFLIEPRNSSSRLGVSLTNLFGPNEGGRKPGFHGDVSEGWLVSLKIFVGANLMRIDYQEEVVTSLTELVSFLDKHLPNATDLVKY